MQTRAEKWDQSLDETRYAVKAFVEKDRVPATGLFVSCQFDDDFVLYGKNVCSTEDIPRGLWCDNATSEYIELRGQRYVEFSEGPSFENTWFIQRSSDPKPDWKMEA